MSDPKICLKCCIYSDNFLDGQSVCIGCSSNKNQYSIENLKKINMKKEEQREAKKYEKNFKHIHGLRKERSQKYVRKASEMFFCFVILFSFVGCMPLSTNSEAFINVQKNLEINSENLVKVGKKLDLVSDKLGLSLPPLTLELKDSLAKLQADNDKKYDILNAQMLEMGKKLLEIGGASVGIPPSVTAGVVGVAGLISTYGGKMVSDIYARRKEERTAQEHAEALAEAEEEAEKERKKLLDHHNEKIAGLKHHMEIIKRCNPAIFEEMANAEKKAKADGVI